ncbi:MAG TPA: hypothetical protein VN231_08970 [Allosphingosinicella sp.]|nr:hypothetical protein [Allosphingosinicella sp.]
MLQYLDDDVVDLRHSDGSTWQFYWGDAVEVLSQDSAGKKVRVHGLKGIVDEGMISAKAKLRSDPILRISMVDVQQGDGLIIDTPSGKVIFVDGGDNELFARHAAARYRGTSPADPLLVDAVVVTHGDADHFEGLTELEKSETHAKPHKRIFMAPRRVYHNGLAKRPGKLAGKNRPEEEMFGQYAIQGGRPYCVDLVDDPGALPDSELNVPFQKWKKALASWAARLKSVTGDTLELRRLDHTSQDAFDFLKPDGIMVELLGPVTETVAGKPALAFFAAPPEDAELMLGDKPGGGSTSWSASHTVNGHSVAFRLSYGNVRFLFTGDMNEESMHRLHQAMPGASLAAEILKTPHHGSADFNFDFLTRVEPVVSLISSGDENEAKEYMHPRATFMAAIGKASRTTPAVIFCTELAAFFKARDYVDDPDPKRAGRRFFAFERTNFGIAHVRTDGERVLAFTHSGKKGTNEAYRFTVASDGKIEFRPKVTKRSAP